MKQIFTLLLLLICKIAMAQDCLENSYLEMTVVNRAKTITLYDCIIKIKSTTDSLWQEYNTGNNKNCKIRIFKKGTYQIEVSKKECETYFDKIVFTKDTIIKKSAQFSFCISCSLPSIEAFYFNTADEKVIEKSFDEKYEMLFLLKKYPAMKIELRGHTNCHGSDKKNQKLSLERANNMKAFFIKKGIEENRIITTGYGETILVNRCVDGVKCNKKEHQANDRVETKILSF
ncbi:MAG: hypothetical protein RL708_710 [Bacteroidota bacterium]